MTPFLESAGWALMHFVWQGAAIAVLAAAALRLTSRRSANVRYVIGCVALALMLAAPAVTMRLLWRANDAVAPGATSDEITAPAGERSRVADGTNAVSASNRCAAEHSCRCASLPASGLRSSIGSRRPSPSRGWPAS